MVRTADLADDFAYGDPGGSSQRPPKVAVFGDSVLVREQIVTDFVDAGLCAVDGGRTATLISGAGDDRRDIPFAPSGLTSTDPVGGDGALAGDVVMVECPQADARTLAGLAWLDQKAARSGARLIVATSMDALDDVFAVLDQSDPQILVAPGRADRVVAVGRVLAELSPSLASNRVREMTQQDRINLLQLSRQVEAIAHRLEGMTGDASGFAGQAVAQLHPARESASGKRSVGDLAFSTGARGEVSGIGGAGKAALPDPHHVRRMIAARQARAKFFEGELFADPAWDMLLDLTAAEGEGQSVSVTSLCIAAGVPATTALRWLKQMVDIGLFERIADPGDRRRAFIALSSTARQAMARYFAEVEAPLAEAA